jgi:hypothetical protein
MTSFQHCPLSWVEKFCGVLGSVSLCLHMERAMETDPVSATLSFFLDRLLGSVQKVSHIYYNNVSLNPRVIFWTHCRGKCMQGHSTAHLSICEHVNLCKDSG